MRPVVAVEVKRHIRLTILRALLESQDSRANANILATMVDEMGLGASEEDVEREIAWLADRDLVETVKVSGIVIAQLTDKGMLVARGRKVVEGVRRPSKKR